ncbi:MAG: lipopolysaccharide assembly protein LapB [Gammaproteobacteria bacterium]|nr:lipopolysaccharide assembly protein LapB [Gammaproteobacteria bacterium]
MSELSWPLLLLAMVVGAALTLGITHKRQSRRSSAGGYPPGYVQGVQDLFSSQPDKAVAVFMKMLELDPSTVEPHFALATLFRKKGEVERAIRIHQNLISRNGLEPEHKRRALEGLARDYLHAGLLDRAETIANNLLETDPKNQEGMRILLSIFELESEWDKAISIAEKLLGTGGILPSVLAQYYCELAELHRHGGNETAARRAIKQALNHDEECPRAGMILGDIEMAAGHVRAAIRNYQRVAWKSPEYLSEIVAPMLTCFGRTDASQATFNTLKKLVLDQSAIDPVLQMTEYMIGKGEEVEAGEYIRGFLHDRPSLEGLRYLMDQSPADPHGRDENHRVVKETIYKLSSASKRYRCDKCGFSGQKLHWQCPSCRVWGQTRPI